MASKKQETQQRPDKGVLGRGQYILLDPDKIVVADERSLRLDSGDSLKESIAKYGVLTPIRVRRLSDGRYELVDGSRRLAGAKQVKKSTKKQVKVPAIVEREMTKKDQLLIRSMVTNDTKPFTPLEYGEAFRKLHEDEGLSIKDIAKAVGKQRGFVEGRLFLVTKAPQFVRDSVLAGDVPIRTVVNVLRSYPDDPDKQVELVKEAVEGGKKSKKLPPPAGSSKGRRLSAARSRSLLVEIANAYTDFVRSRSPAYGKNPAWRKLTKTLSKIRALKREGQLTVKSSEDKKGE